MHKENSEQHQKLFDNINRLNVANASKESELTKVYDDKYASKESLDRMEKVLNRLIVVISTMVLGVTGWALVELFNLLTESVKAFF